MGRHPHLDQHVARLHTREALAFAEAKPLEFVRAVEQQFSGLNSLLKRGASNNPDQSTPNQSNNITVPVALGVVYVNASSVDVVD